ncbi:hypothetical protein M758_7G020100 [Ceratodon purpureus]|nr:hypothetical protein M758_7G020100 [Ceratodon purpureus]
MTPVRGSHPRLSPSRPICHPLPPKLLSLLVPALAPALSPPQRRSAPGPRTCSHPKAANMRASVPLGCMWRVLISTPSLEPLPGLPTTKLIFPVIPIHSHNTLRAASGLPSPINKYLNEPTQDNCLLELHFLRSVTCRQCLQSPVIINFAHNLQSFSKFRFHYLSED